MKASESMMNAIEATRENAVECEAILDMYAPGDEMTVEHEQRVKLLIEATMKRARNVWFHYEVSIRKSRGM